MSQNTTTEFAAGFAAGAEAMRRTVRSWLHGQANAEFKMRPDGAAQELMDLSAQIERGVGNVFTLVAELAQKHGDAAEITLYRYRTVADYSGSRADQDGLPWPCHNAMIGRVMVRMHREARAFVVAWADPAV